MDGNVTGKSRELLHFVLILWGDAHIMRDAPMWFLFVFFTPLFFYG